VGSLFVGRREAGWGRGVKISWRGRRARAKLAKTLPAELAMGESLGKSANFSSRWGVGNGEGVSGKKVK